jgi:hypothetical protein
MFERVVTLTYLNENPHEIGLLLNFIWVERQKLIEENPEEIGENISPEYVEKTKAKVNGIAKDYVRLACEKCKTLRLNERWSPKSVVTLAKEVGFMFPLIKSSYYLPAEQFWAGAAGDNQIEPGIVRGSWFNELPDAHAPDAPAHIAHWLALETLFVLKERLAIDELEEPLSRCVSDFYFVRVEQGT